MNGVSGRADGNPTAGATLHSGSDGCPGRLEQDQGSLLQRLEASIRLFDALLRQNRALRQETAVLAEALTKASRFAYHDELTGLPKRRLLKDDVGQAVARAIDKVIGDLVAPYHIDSTPVSLRATFGVATFPADGQNHHELLQAADVTMCRNKVSRRTVPSHAPEAALVA